MRSANREVRRISGISRWTTTTLKKVRDAKEELPVTSRQGANNEKESQERSGRGMWEIQMSRKRAEDRGNCAEDKAHSP